MKNKYVNKTGYKKGTESSKNPYNIIPSNNITMKGIDFPIFGIDDLGNIQIMTPENNYTFPGSNVLEIPLSEKGGIHIKPENKGKFTKWAKAHNMGVQEAASYVMANKNKYSPSVVKMANFAKNASKFKHQDGGIGDIGDELDLTDEQIQYFKSLGYEFDDLENDTINNNLTNIKNNQMNFKSFFQDGGQMQPQQTQPESQDQIQQIVQAFAQIQGIDPQQVMQQLQSLPPDQQQQAIQAMVQAIQQAQGQPAAQGMQQTPPEQVQMQYGGMAAQDIYIMGVLDAMKKKSKTPKKKDGGTVSKEQLSFGESFMKARNMGKKSFMYEGKEHTTKFSFE